jgi:hypothetical protein
VTEPRGDDPVDDHRADEDREISDVGLPRAGDDRTDDTTAAANGHDEDDDRGPVADGAALDEVFPPEGGRT